MPTFSVIDTGSGQDTFYEGMVKDAANWAILEVLVPVGTTATQTLTNKTLTTPVINCGSDATGDLYYRNGSTFTRLAKGASLQALRMNVGATIPSWVTVPLLVVETGATRSASATELLSDVVYTSSYAGETTITLIAGATGHRFKAVVTVAQYLKFAANGTEKFRCLAAQSAAGGYIRSNVVGNVIELIWSGSEWVVSSIGGSWTYDS